MFDFYWYDIQNNRHHYNILEADAVDDVLSIFLESIEPRKKPGWLGYIGDYTTQLYWDYNIPL